MLSFRTDTEPELLHSPDYACVGVINTSRLCLLMSSFILHNTYIDVGLLRAICVVSCRPYKKLHKSHEVGLHRYKYYAI